eukprot:scaffold13182_cov64-Attheya_sp.AAC.9
MKTHSRAPTHEYRTSIAKVEEWFLLTREAQDVKLEEWRKMSRSKKQKLTDMIPNQENNKRRPSRDVVATRSGQSQDKRIKKAKPVAKKTTSLDSSEAERKEAQGKYRAEPKARRTKKCNARAVHSILVQLVQPQLVFLFHILLVFIPQMPPLLSMDGMPRHTNYLVSFNEVHRTKKGRQPKQNETRQKFYFLEHRAMRTDIRDEVSSHTQKQLAAVSESSFKTVDFHSTENVVAANTVHIPSPAHISHTKKRRQNTVGSDSGSGSEFCSNIGGPHSGSDMSSELGSSESG